MTGVHICNFSSPIAELKRKDRTPDKALSALAKHPRVSSFDMSEHYKWLPSLLNSLEKAGLIQPELEPYPWLRYSITEAGRKALAATTQEKRSDKFFRSAPKPPQGEWCCKSCGQTNSEWANKCGRCEAHV